MTDHQDEDQDFEAREAKVRDWFKDQADRATALRSKEREFHGLEREFRYDQALMLGAFARTKDMKHPRDLGDAREIILRKFLNESGYLPKRYGVSERSFRAAATSGHISRELDIALYDPLDSIRLMQSQDTFEVLPIESVYGAIQVKSRLNKKEIRDGLANLASVKRLEKRSPMSGLKIIQGRPKSERPFGILFAYDTDLEWPEIIKELEAFAKANPKTEWTNAVYILNKGFFLFGDKDKGAQASNSAIESINTLQIYGVPDRQEQCLYAFQSALVGLLRDTEVYPASLEDYFRLPLVAGANSYSFRLGQFAEIGNCQTHGDFIRAISPEALEKVVRWCRGSEPINWVRSIHLAYGMPEDEEAYRRQPGEVYIYNPENLPLSQVLTHERKAGEVSYSGFACDMIETDGLSIQIPYYYSLKEGIVTLFCPKCPNPMDAVNLEELSASADGELPSIEISAGK